MPSLGIQRAKENLSRGNRPDNDSRAPVEGWLGDERRTEDRVQTDGVGRLKVVDPLMTIGPSVPVRILDVSAGGLKLQVPRGIYVGALVQVQLPHRVVFAEVRYCKAAGTEFQIGVDLKDVFGTDRTSTT